MSNEINTNQDEIVEEFSSENDLPEMPKKPAESPVIAFGKKYGMRIMTTGFVIFATGIFFYVSSRGTQWTTIISGIGFALYVTGRILCAIAKKR